MKIAIATFHRALNYGAVLQAYALQKTIQNLDENLTVEVLDYDAPFFGKSNKLKNQISKNPLKSLLKIFNVSIRKKRFGDFVNKNIKVSKKKYTIKTIFAVGAEYDLFITGSDQVWNPNITGKDLNYLLPFCSADKRTSYAASMGVENIAEDLQEEYIRLLNSFSAISVREQTAISTLQQLGVNVSIQKHIDPALLLTSEEWLNLTKKIPKQKDKYILVFAVNRSKELVEKAVQFAQTNGYKIKYIGPYIRNSKTKYRPSLSVEKVLASFRDAELVFTNSFHGTVFSIQFKKRFCSFMPGGKGTSSRVLDLLTILGLTERIEEENIEKEIEWQGVENVLTAERLRACEYLKAITHKAI